MHKVHSKFLRLFSFHREARFASSSPDYDIFSQHCRHGFAYFNVNAGICANSQIYRHTHTHTHVQWRLQYFCWEKLIALKPFPLRFPLWIKSVLSPPFLLSHTSSGICYQMRSQAHHFKLERGKKWADLLETSETEWLWRGHRGRECLFESVLKVKWKRWPTFDKVTSCCSANNGHIYMHAAVWVLSWYAVFIEHIEEVSTSFSTRWWNYPAFSFSVSFGCYYFCSD